MATLFIVTRFPTRAGAPGLGDALEAAFDARQSQLSQ